MNKVLSTAELQKTITTIILEKIPEADKYIEEMIRFQAVDGKQAIPYVYLFSRLGSYRIVYVGDRCDILSEIETDDLREVLWYALEAIIFNMATDYELSTRQKPGRFAIKICEIMRHSKIVPKFIYSIAIDVLKPVPKYDTRLIMFAKREQLFGLFGEDFKRRIREYHDEVLSRCPYDLD